MLITSFQLGHFPGGQIHEFINVIDTVRFNDLPGIPSRLLPAFTPKWRNTLLEVAPPGRLIEVLRHSADVKYDSEWTRL